MNNREAMQEAFETFMANDDKFPDGCNMTERVFNAGYDAALAAQQQDHIPDAGEMVQAQPTQEPTLKNNEFIPDSIEGRIQAAIKCLNLHWVSHDANRFDYAIEGLEKCLVDLKSQAQEPKSKWMPIETSPKNKKIIVRYKNVLGKDRTVFAKYLDKFTEEATAGTDCETDYCEDDDTFYCKEGWVELIDNWDEFSSVYFDSNNVPTHWMDIPPAPEGDK